MSRDSILKEKSAAYGRRIVKLGKYLKVEQHEFVLANQIIRSGTSIGANIAEAIYGSSRKDFIAKLQIAQKEASETLYWLDMIYSGEYISERLYRSFDAECRELLAMLAASIKTACQ